jgi:hypothetical protein
MWAAARALGMRHRRFEPGAHAARGQVLRIGPQHQAGSDSLLTAATFFKMRAMYFENAIDKVRAAARACAPWRPDPDWQGLQDKFLNVLFGLGMHLKPKQARRRAHFRAAHGQSACRRSASATATRRRCRAWPRAVARARRSWSERRRVVHCKPRQLAPRESSAAGAECSSAQHATALPFSVDRPPSTNTTCHGARARRNRLQPRAHSRPPPARNEGFCPVEVECVRGRSPSIVLVAVSAAQPVRTRGAGGPQRNAATTWMTFASNSACSRKRASGPASRGRRRGA